MFNCGRMGYIEEEPCCGRSFRHGYGLGHGLGYGYAGDKSHLEFARKELENRLDYVNKELVAHTDDPELNFAKRELDNRLSYVGELLSKAVK